MKLHSKAQRILALLAVAFASSTAAAADPIPIAPYEPVQGAWYPVGKPGNYVNVDVGPTGFTFVSIHDFPNGVERVRYLQGPLERSSDADWESTGIRARMRSRVYVQEGGSCIGCPYVPETTRDLNQGDAEIRFLNGSTGSLLLEGQTIPIGRYPMFTDTTGYLQNRVAGRWLRVAREKLADRIDIVTIAPLTPPPLPNTYLAAPPDVPDTSPPLDRWFSVTCNTCAAQGPSPIGLLVVHDGGKLVLYHGGGGFGIHTYFAEYRLTDLEGMIQGRGIPSVIARNDNTPDPNFSVVHDFTLLPLPADWRQ